MANIPPFNIELEYANFPNRLAIILSGPDKKRVKELLTSWGEISSTMPTYDEDKYPNYKDFEKLYNSWAEETRADRYEISSELRQIQDRIEATLLKKVKTPDKLYKEISKLVNGFTLTMDREAQKRHTSVNTNPLFSTFTGYPIMRVTFKRDGELIEDALLACMGHISKQADIENLLAICNKQGWDYTPIQETIEARAKFLLSPEGEQMERETADRIIAQIKAEQAETAPASEQIPSHPNNITIPTSPTTFAIMEVLTVGPELDSLPDKKKHITHGQKYEVMKKGPARRVIYKGAETVTLEITDIATLSKRSGPAKKLITRTLEKANEQAIYNGELTQDYVSFPLQDLVDDGQFTNIRSARRGFEDASRALSSFKGEKSGKDDFTLEVFFTGARIKKGQCYLFLNPRIDWARVAKYFTEMPSYYYALPDKASDLLFYVFYIARQRTEDIKEKGYFTISLRSIQGQLNLPDEKDNKNPQRDIKDPIENAVEKIEEKHRETFNDTSLQFELLYGDGLPIPEGLAISEYLESGYLKVILNNELSAHFVEINKKNARKRLEAERKKERQEAIKQAKIEDLREQRNDR